MSRALLTIALALVAAGCDSSGSGTKEYGQDFAKPADGGASAPKAAPSDNPGGLSPKERRQNEQGTDAAKGKKN